MPQGLLSRAKRRNLVFVSGRLFDYENGIVEDCYAETVHQHISWQLVEAFANQPKEQQCL